MNVNERFYLYTYTVTYINKVPSFIVHYEQETSFSLVMSQVAHQAGTYLQFL